MGEFEDFLRAEIKKAFEEELAKQPWWCLICGAGGNYEGERPDGYLPPPLEHECRPIELRLKGLKGD